jgi:hypothetical protein
MSFFKLTLMGYQDKLKETKHESSNDEDTQPAKRRELTLNQIVKKKPIN